MKFIALAFLTLTVTAQAYAFPLTSQNWGGKLTINSFFTPGFNFQGIIALSNCSGSLVRFKSSQASDKAMMLTNGHCVSTGIFGGFLKPGQVLVNEPAQYSVSLLDKNGSTLQGLSSTRILYATMTGTDVALFELDETYADIQTQSSTPALTLADGVPQMGTDIQIPSGYWKRTYACKTDVIIPELKEADWTFTNSIRYSETGCDIIGGTSGSPIVSSQTGEVIGINNTSNEDGEQCTMNNPCEVDQAGHETVRQGRSYGQQTYLFYGCLAAQGSADRLNLNQASCQLAKPH